MLLIDAYNVLHTTGILPPDLAGIELDGLARLIASSRYARERTILVCDGSRPNPPPDTGPIEARFAGPGRDADSLIEDLLKTQSRTGRAATVVSTDRRVRQAARRRKARWLSSAEFLSQLTADHAAPKPSPQARTLRPAFATDLPLDPSAARTWLQVMGIRPDDPIMRIVAAAGHAVIPDPPPPAPDHPHPSSPPPPTKPDPLLTEALKEWPGRLSLDDLDMSKWLSPPPRGRG